MGTVGIFSMKCRSAMSWNTQQLILGKSISKLTKCLHIIIQ